MLPKKIPLFQKKLLAWYKTSARDLPWRRTRDPYKIWISEIMLQQTQVDTVIPYYEKWLARFPTVHALAQADLESVLQRWAGLGYYRRARMIHQAAEKIAGDFGGKVPDSVEGLLKLPGVGRYTAGAIASIAYGVKAPIVDGNVIRVITRIWGIGQDVSKKSTLEEIWKLAENLILLTPTLSSKIKGKPSSTPSPSGRGQGEGCNLPGDFNQALMELGATICFPANPECKKCPVSGFCQAKKEGSPERYPVKDRKEKLEKLRSAALLLQRNGSVLLQKQSKEARWGGLWMFPHWENKKAMLNELNLNPLDLKKRLSIRHGFTKYIIDLEVYEIVNPSKKKVDLDGSDCFIQMRKGRRMQPEGSSRSLLELGFQHHSEQESKRRERRGRPPLERLDLGAERLHPAAKIPEKKWVKIKALSKLPFPSPHQKIVRHILENPS